MRKLITKYDVQINAWVELYCLTCGNKYQDDNNRDPSDFDNFLAEVIEDANSKGWKSIDGQICCPECLKINNVSA